jgi:hypothetical protein
MLQADAGRKAQIEIVGLLIIVVMVSFMLLLVAKALVTKPPSPVSDYAPQSEASSFMNAMLMTSSFCTEDTDVSNLVKNCAQSPETGGSLTCTNGSRSCEFLDGILGQMLGNSFDSMKKNYEFVIKTANNEVIYSRNCSKQNHCTTYAPAKAYTWTQPLPTDAPGMDVTLMMCMGGCGFSED